jgi:hypothetical protein
VRRVRARRAAQASGATKGDAPMPTESPTAAVPTEREP